ncbi:ferredoxin [Actinoallomurus spadix]|uniref:Ferredoxin n=1 Tax=Actinoallomurus spadix TaxID=79912 RepID=A0ABP3FBC5_9ACTN|nr:ferredoxin [Actinoallomurus spadix]MCO5991228.1 ferredoxin [Actinoallomurus spadix]
MRVTVDLGLCESHGQCVFAAPEVFAFDDDDNLRYESEPPAALSAQVEQAAALCPVRAVSVRRTAP